MGKLSDAAYKILPVKWFLDFFKNLRFRWKLFLSYIIVVIIPLSVLGVYSYDQAKNFLTAETRLWMNESATQITEKINSKFTRYNSMMDYIVYNSQFVRIVNDVDSSYYQQYLDFGQTISPIFITVTNLLDELDALKIYTDNENLLVRADYFSNITDVHSEPWYGEIAGKINAYWNVKDNKLMAYKKFYQPFQSSPENILFAQFDYEDVFSVEKTQTNEYGIIITNENEEIVFNEKNITFSNYSDVGLNLEKIIERDTGEIEYESVKYLIIKKDLIEFNWALYYYSPLDMRTVGAINILSATLIIIAACIVLLILLTWVFSNTLVRRIYNLNNKMKMVSEGNINIEVKSTTKDEIGELTNKFGEMLKEINILIEEVYQSKITQREAEMKALQAQINPHYLYNTLSLINWKAIQIDAMEISRISRTISKYYRTVLNSGKVVISVEDEIVNTKSYLEIQLMMHDNQFDVVYNLDDEIFKYDMIKIIIQPIVENAIEHGIDRLKSGHGEIRISGRVSEECIEFIICDNGPGIEENQIDEILKTESKGYGLKNVNERIKKFFGPQFGLSITGNNPQGTCVKVCIPKFKDNTD